MKAKTRVLFPQLYQDRNENDFNASRHGMRFLKICGEILSSDTTRITPFVHALRAKIDEMKLTHVQIYNADESGFFYQLIPERTYVACEKTARGEKFEKNESPSCYVLMLMEQTKSNRFRLAKQLNHVVSLIFIVRWAMTIPQTHG